jgi:5-methyltetrahydropteroyltriglutamate--homocysteine methyltransferase
MKRSTLRLLTTHTGSLARPEHLADLMLRRERGEPFGAEELQREVRQAVSDAVRRQAQLGIDIVSDGEMSKPGFNNYVKDRLTGFGGEESPTPNAEFADFPDFALSVARAANIHATRRAVDSDEGTTGGVSARRAPACNGPIALADGSAVATDIANLRAALDGLRHAQPEQTVEEAFIPAASPGSVALIMANQYYPTLEAYLAALADALSAEYRAIVDSGFVLQIDCPDLAMCGHRQYAHATREEFRSAMELHVEALNQAIGSLPADRIRVHVCYGNYLGPHHLDRPFSDIVDIVLKVRADGLSFEAANSRHEHEWRVWSNVTLPHGKVLIPGVVDTHTYHVEHPRTVADRLVRLANLVGKEHVIAGTECGFGTFVGVGLPPSIGWAKLRSLVDGARLASQELFP